MSVLISYLFIHPACFTLHDRLPQLVRHPIAAPNIEANVCLGTNFVHVLPASTLASAESCLYVICSTTTVEPFHECALVSGADDNSNNITQVCSTFVNPLHKKVLRIDGPCFDDVTAPELPNNGVIRLTGWATDQPCWLRLKQSGSQNIYSLRARPKGLHD